MKCAATCSASALPSTLRRCLAEAQVVASFEAPQHHILTVFDQQDGIRRTW